MKKIFVLMLFAGSLFVYYGCSSSPSESNVLSDQEMTSAQPLQKSTAVTELSADEIAGLKHMREEEKLARDVYTAMYRKWNLRVFKNIIQSEQNHMNAVLVLLKRYSITDPVGSNGDGKFSDIALQDLYTRLIEQGNKSAKDALLVGVDIEKLDISDLQHQIDKVVKSTDILRVYTNLKAGSDNHLAAFNFNLQNYAAEE